MFFNFSGFGGGGRATLTNFLPICFMISVVCEERENLKIWAWGGCSIALTFLIKGLNKALSCLSSRPISTEMTPMFIRLWANLSSASFVLSASLSFMFAVSILIRQSGLFALMKPSLNSLRNGNFALSAARSLSITAEPVPAGSLGLAVGCRLWPLRPREGRAHPRRVCRARLAPWGLGSLIRDIIFEVITYT